MSVWGHQSFENDDALDWTHALVIQGADAIRDASRSVLAAKQRGETLGVSLCACAIAAAEVLAAWRGRPGPEQLPVAVSEWIGTATLPSPALVTNAVKAIDAILEESELLLLWTRAQSGRPWIAALQRLRGRLLQPQSHPGDHEGSAATAS
jgi:hypothetical protein